MTTGVHVSSDEVMVALRACDETDRDAASGGWHPSTICDGESFCQSTCLKHLRRLREAGRVERVNGIGPHGPRETWLPVDHEDAPPEREDGPTRRLWIDE